MANALTKIKADALTADLIDETKLADNSIDSEHYNDGSIDHEHLANDAVDADILADNSVGLAAMAHGTDGNLITFDANGAPAYVATGNDGQVLTSAGAGAAPAFETISTSDTLSFRNVIINGAMNVSQRQTTTTTSGQFVLDRFKAGWTGADENITHAKRALTSSDSGPWAAGFRNCLSLTNGNQTSGAGAGDDVWIEYPIEDQDLASSAWQCESASSKITLSFWLKASVAQTYYVILETKHGTSKNFAFAATISSANTWTKITKTIPGHADISFGNDNGEGIDIYFVPFYGTDKTTSNHTVDAWSNTSASDQMPDMTSTWWTTNDATFEITGVQLEVGDTATDFEHRPYAYELARCERYYEVQRMNTGTGGYYAHSNSATGNTRYHNMSEFRCHKRASPTVTLVATANVNTPTLFPSSTHIGLYHQSGTFYLTCNHDTVVWTIDAEL